MKRIVLALLLCFAAEAFAQSSPLIMKHADSLAVARKRGTLILHGRVVFVHDSVQFRTQRAVWNKDNEEVLCEGGFKFLHPSGYMEADRGTYRKKDNIATATGNVRAGDSAHTYYVTGEHLVYNRETEVLDIPQKPHLYQFEKKKDGTEDTLSVSARQMVYNKKDAIAEAKRDVVIRQKDVTISADAMNYRRQDDFAEAFDHVKMVQQDMVVTCDTGYFDRKNNWLSMKGHPTCDLKNYHLTGDSIFLTLDSTGNSLKSALVVRNAHGVQQEEGKGRTPGHVTEAFGDTLYAQFQNDKIEQLYVNLNAHGFFYETDLKDYRNLMDGNRLDMFFKKGKMDHAVVSGKAQSTYFYVKNDRTVSGKNEAAGDTIHLLFDAQKNAVKSLRLLGNKSSMASGRYVDMEKENRNKLAAKSDSLMAERNASDVKNGTESVRRPRRSRPSKSAKDSTATRPVEDKH